MKHEIEAALADFNNPDTPAPAKQNLDGAGVEQELLHQEFDDQYQQTREH